MRKIPLTIIKSEEIKHKILEHMKKYKLDKFFRIMLKQYKSYSPIILNGNVAFVVNWREGRMFRGILKSIPEFSEFPDSYFEKNWIKILTEVLYEKS